MIRSRGLVRALAVKPGWLGAVLLLWPILAAALDPSRAITQYRLDRWTRREGIPQLSVLCMLQDRAGYLWLGTQEGLARFDGVAFRSFKVDDTPALASNYVSALYEDRRGRIWIGTDTGNVSWFDGGRFEAVPRGNVLPGFVVGFAESARGDLFAAFRGAGLQRFAGGRLEPVADRGGHPIGLIASLARGRKGEVWAGGEGRLYRLALDGGWVRYDLPGASGRRVTELAVAPNGELALSENDARVRRVHPNGRSLETLPPVLVRPGLVRALFFDRDGTLWIGDDYGMARRRAAPGAPVEPWPAGPGTAVRSFFEDREGGLWIGTNLEGLLRLRADEVVPLGAAEGLPDDSAWNVMAASDGALWITTDGGLARRAGNRIERVSVPGLPSEDAIALGERRDGSIWLGTFRHGLYRLPRGGEPLLRWTSAEGVPAGPMTVVFEDSRGRLWVGSREGLAVEAGARFEGVRLVEGDVQPYVVGMVEDREGTLWISTNAGLFAHGPEGLRHFGKSDGLATNSLTGLLIDHDGRLWIGTWGQGIQIRERGRFLSVGRRQGLPAGSITWMVEDDLGGLWFSSNQGLFRAGRKALLRVAQGAARRVEVRRFGLGDGMLQEECAGTGQPAGTRTRDGRVWFPTAAGVVSVDPLRLRPPVPPRPALEALVAGGRSLPLSRTAPLDLAPSRGDLEIRFTALGLDEAAGTRFRYRLHGYDGTWIDAGRRRSAFYTGLSPRSYRFEVQALHEDGGAWSPPASLAFRLRPHVYETAWFRALLAFAAALALYGGIRWRSRRLEQRAAKLAVANESLAEGLERQAALRQEAEAARQRAESAQREAEHHAQEARRAAEAKEAFLATVSHELRTPLNGVLGFSNLLLGSELDLRQREFVEIIRTSGETLLALVNQILDLSQSDRGKLALAAEPFWVPDCFEESVELVGSAAAAKGLDLALAIDADAHRSVVGDRTRLRAIATNLLANAVKFTESGGVLARVRARSEEGVLALELVVSDTGIGIAPENHSRIFQPFEQVDSSLARRYGGAGLGLAIARRLCGWMQGTLNVESGLGKGSTFTATVRLDLDPAPAAPPKGLSLEGRHVLLAGLSGQTLEAVVRQLETWGATVSTSWEGAGEAGRGFAFGITTEDAEPGPGLEIPWIRLVSPDAAPTPAPAGIDLLRPVRPSRLGAAVREVLGSLAPEAPEDRVPKATPAASPAILVVEDDPVSRHLLYVFLDNIGYAADTADSGEAALQALEARHYDLLLLDIQMPGMDGFELARRVRARCGMEGQPRLVAVTASAMEGDRERCLAAGMDDYLSKPVRPEQLAAVVAG